MNELVFVLLAVQMAATAIGYFAAGVFIGIYYSESKHWKREKA